MGTGRNWILFRIHGNNCPCLISESDTVQVADYSKYDMSAFCEEAKKAHHDEQFPLDLRAAYNMGVELSK